jgi:proteasome lid subunit RPN8/RPN11
MAENTESRVRIFPELEQPSTAPDSFSQIGGFGAASIPKEGLGGYTLYRCDGQTEMSPGCDIIFPQSLYQKVVGHLSQDATREHGGFLLGYELPATDSAGPTVAVTDAIAAQYTEGSPVRLAFTTETWRDLDKQISEKYKEPGKVPQRIGWYHSHPDIAIFLSHWDLDVCKTYDRRKTPIALVVDPVKNRGGFFVGGKNGYRPQSPQGFYEHRDLQSETIVTWTNMTEVDRPATKQTPGRTFPTEEDERQEVLTSRHEQPYLARLSRVALAVVLVLMATAIAALWIKQRRADTTINAMAAEILNIESSTAKSQVGTAKPLPEVSVNPANASLSASQVQEFKADVRGLDDKGVTWSRTPKIGTVSSDGLYTAPPRILQDTVVTVKATSSDDPTKSATATLTLSGGTPIEGISLNMTHASLRPSESKRFLAKITGTLSGQRSGLSWSIDPSSRGTIKDGVYTAPSVIPTRTTVVIKATSRADTSKFASATVTLESSSPPPHAVGAEPKKPPSVSTAPSSASPGDTPKSSDTDFPPATAPTQSEPTVPPEQPNQSIRITDPGQSKPETSDGEMKLAVAHAGGSQPRDRRSS